MKVFLRIQTHDSNKDVQIEANTSISLGRSQKCTYKIPDDLLSGQHLEIRLIPPKLQIYDLDSKNGSYLNGIRIEHADFFIGDMIRIGNTKIFILKEKCDAQAVYSLKFPGSTKERAEHELQIDYEGVNDYFTPEGLRKKVRPALKSRDLKNQLKLRRDAQTSIRVSKHEIKQIEQTKSSLASMIDTLFLIVSLIIPLLLVNFLLISSAPVNLVKYRAHIIILIEILSGFLAYYINFRFLKFSIGEKIAGIQDFYENQG